MPRLHGLVTKETLVKHADFAFQFHAEGLHAQTNELSNKALSCLYVGDLYCAVFVTKWNGNMDGHQLMDLSKLMIYDRPTLVCMNQAGHFEAEGHLPTKQVCFD